MQQDDDDDGLSDEWDDAGGARDNQGGMGDGGPVDASAAAERDVGRWPNMRSAYERVGIYMSSLQRPEGNPRLVVQDEAGDRSDGDAAYDSSGSAPGSASASAAAAAAVGGMAHVMARRAGQRRSLGGLLTVGTSGLSGSERSSPSSGLDAPYSAASQGSEGAEEVDDSVSNNGSTQSDMVGGGSITSDYSRSMENLADGDGDGEGQDEAAAGPVSGSDGPPPVVAKRTSLSINANAMRISLGSDPARRASAVGIWGGGEPLCDMP